MGHCHWINAFVNHTSLFAVSKYNKPNFTFVRVEGLKASNT